MIKVYSSNVEEPDVMSEKNKKKNKTNKLHQLPTGMHIYTCTCSTKHILYIPVHESVTGLICYIRATGTLTLYQYYITGATIVRPTYTFT